jgi:hypothetical protein
MDNLLDLPATGKQSEAEAIRGVPDAMKEQVWQRELDRAKSFYSEDELAAIEDAPDSEHEAEIANPLQTWKKKDVRLFLDTLPSDDRRNVERIMREHGVGR